MAIYTRFGSKVTVLAVFQDNNNTWLRVRFEDGSLREYAAYEFRADGGWAEIQAVMGAIGITRIEYTANNEPIAAPAAEREYDAKIAREEAQSLYNSDSGVDADDYRAYMDKNAPELVGSAAQYPSTTQLTAITADLATQHEYALYIGDEPTLAAQFQLQQAVKTSFWGNNSGRIVSISQDGPRYFYEVQLGSGRIVLEPEAYLIAAPELEATLPQVSTRRPLTAREIEARLDAQDYDAGNSSGYCQWNGIDQLNPDAR